jgi:hypothetical protein
MPVLHRRSLISLFVALGGLCLAPTGCKTAPEAEDEKQEEAEIQPPGGSDEPDASSREATICSNDLDCPSDSVCIEGGRCAKLVECQSDLDCSGDSTCFEGHCILK